MTGKRWIALGVAVLAMSIWSAPGHAAGLQPVKLTKLWELSGFRNPESVVYEPGEGVFYVSNMDGGATAKDGRGEISKVSLAGKMLDPNWVTGLDAPKGLAISGGALYVADIDRLVRIRLADRKVTRFTARRAKLLNDVTAGSKGRIFVSDWMGDAIYRLADGKFRLWLKNPALRAPNGLLAEKDRLVVASWGRMVDGFATKTPGHLLTVSFADRKLADLGDGRPVGNLDGLEADGTGNYFVTDWMAGGLLRISPSGEAVLLLDLPQGSADLEYVADKRLIVIPMMNEGKLVAYRVAR